MNIAASDSHRVKAKAKATAKRRAHRCITLAFVRESDAAETANQADGSDSAGDDTLAQLGAATAVKGALGADGSISAALGPLREVVASLGRARTGWFPGATEQQRLTRRARRAGQAVLPSLLRSLGAASDHEAIWAHCLLRGIAGPKTKGPLRGRVLERLSQLLRSARHADQVKARVLTLLSDLGAPLGDEVVLRDPSGLLAGSVHELLSSLDGAAEIDQAVDLIFAQVPEAELASFLHEVAQHGGAVARPLFSALLADSRLPRELALRFMAQYRPTPPPMRDAAVATSTLGRRPRPARERMVTRLAAALNLLHEGKLTQARSRLNRLLTEFADQPAVHSALGLCLLRLGEPHDALAPLECARALEPTVAAHAWNHACAAHAAQRLGTCYRSLNSYLAHRDDLDGWASRRRTAEKFCRTYEQSRKSELPEPAPGHLPEHFAGNVAGHIVSQSSGHSSGHVSAFGEEYSGRA